MKLFPQFLIVIAVATTNCALATDIKIGLSLSLSGPNSSGGIPFTKGMQAATAYKPEVNGRKLHLIILDDGSDPSAASRNARKLVDQEKVDVLMGTSGTPAAVAMAQVAKESQTPMIGLSPMPVDPKDNGWLVTVAQPAQLMVDAVVDKMKKDGVKTVAYIGFSDAWGDLVYGALGSATQRTDIRVLTDQRYARSDSSVTGQVLKAVALRPDAMMTGGAGTPGALPFLALAERGFKGAIYGQHGLINADFVRTAGTAAQGAIMSTGPIIVAEQLPDAHPSKAIGMAYRTIYQKVNGEATTDAYSAYAFDGWLVLSDAVSRTKGEPGTPAYRTELRDAIQSVKEVVGTHGVYNFKPGQLYGVDERARVLVRLDKGRWKLDQ